MTTDEGRDAGIGRLPARQIAVGFGVALAILAGLLIVVDWRAVASELSAVDVPTAVLALPAILIAFTLYSEAQRRLLATAGVELSRGRMWVRYVAAAGVRMVIPLGQATGPAILAYAVRSEAEGGTEQAFAATTVGGLASHAAQLTLALAGLGVVATTDGLGGRLAVWIGGAVVVLVTTLLAFGVLVRLRRSVLRRVALAAAVGGRATVGRVSGRARTALSPGAVAGRVDRFGGAVDAVAERPRAVAAAFALHVVGWTFAAGSLSIALLAMGRGDLAALGLLLVPTAGLVALLPLPGGLGGVEVALTALLVDVGRLGAPAAAAAVLLYRLSAYWFVLAVGGVALAALTAGRVGTE